MTADLNEEESASKLIVTVGAALIALNANVVFAKLAKEEYKRSKDAIEAEYKSARALRLAGRQCQGRLLKEAKGNRKAAADLDARDKNTNKPGRKRVKLAPKRTTASPRRSAMTWAATQRTSV